MLMRLFSKRRISVKRVDGLRGTGWKRDSLQFLFILAEQSPCCTIWAHASHHRNTLFESVQPLLALSEQRALRTFFSLLLSASLLRCGLKVSSPEPCASSGGRLPEAFFLVFRLESQGAKACKSYRSRQELSNEYLLAKLGVDTAENEPLKVCQKLAKS